MSRRAQIEEEFDDDTDLPLPSFPLPANGALLEEINNQQGAGPATQPRQQPQRQQQQPPSRHNTVSDITPYKSWSCIYPIYIDAKRPYGTGERRVERAKSVWWPLSADIADATNRLGLGTLHEISKSHPRDWENPGRVRVQWKKDGRLVNPSIKNKKQLLEMISIQIQRAKPENTPKPPFVTQAQSKSKVKPPKPPTATATMTAASGKPKAKQTAPTPKSASKLPAAAPGAPTTDLQPSTEFISQNTNPRTPNPPTPHPPLSQRLSPYSPAVPSGVLVETVKAGMNAQQQEAAASAATNPGAAAGAPGASGPGGGAVGKGKRKVVRVRG